nr:BTAD domain-containing putative transcriptional regulator [Saccharothrix variisporea]
MLGPLAVGAGGGEIGLASPKLRLLLATLLGSPNVPVSTDRLIEALWDVPPASAADNVRLYVHQLRRALGEKDRVVRHPGGYAVRVEAGELDAARFAELVDSGVAALAGGDSERARRVLDEALGLWRGPAYGELADLPTVRPVAMSLEEARLRATESWVDAELAAGRFADVVVELTELSARHRFRERLHAQLMTALYRSGRRADALEVYERVRRELVAELGLEPGAELRELHEAVLRGRDLGRAAQRRERPAAANPYLGLIPYQPEHRALFFGRDDLVARVTAMVERKPVVAVLGASGSGKSSLLRAGLVARLADDRRVRAVVLTPTAHPERALAEACPLELDAEDGRLVLVLDQAEELFTLCADADERARFLDHLVTTAVAAQGRLVVVFGMRADFLPQLSHHPAVLDALGDDGTVIMGPPSPAELREIITLPAQQAGATVDPDLLATLLADLGSEPGSLPLLSHAMRQTWRNRTGDGLTIEAYRATGGVLGAVAHTAERVYEQFTAEEKTVLRLLLVRLTALGDGTDDTRRPIARSEFDGVADPGVVAEVLDRLVEERLVVIDGTTIDLAHEAVIRAWPRLRRWLSEDRADLLVHRRLTAAAQTWRDLDEDPDALYRGGQLLTATAWAQRRGAECNETERAFLHAGQARADQELRGARRRTRTLQRLVAALAVVLVGALVATAVAVWQGSEAGRGRAVELAHRVAGSATGMLDTAPDLAGLLAVEAHALHPDPDTRGALLSTAAAARRRIDLNAGGSPVSGVAVDPAGRTVATADADGTVSLWDLGSRSVTARFTDHSAVLPDAETRRVAFTAGGTRLASLARLPAVGPAAGSVVVWDVATGKAVFQRRFDAITAALAVDPGGRLLAVGRADGAIEVWDTRDGTSRVLAGAGKPAVSLTINPSATHLVAAHRGVAPTVWDLATGARVAAVDTGEANFVAFDAHADTLVTSSPTQRVRAWRWTGTAVERVAELPARAPLAWDVSPPVGDRVAVVDENGLVTVWDLRRGSVLAAYPDRGRAEARALELAEDGTTLVSVGVGRTVVVRRDAVPRFSGHGDAVSSLAVSPSGAVVASGGYDRTVRLWRADGTPLALLDAGVDPAVDRVEAVAFSPDGTLVAGVGRNHVLAVWDVATGRRVAATRYEGMGASTDVVFARDGRSVVVAGSIRFRFTVPDLAPLRVSRPSATTMLAVTADGVLASADPAGTALLWDLGADAEVGRVPTGQGSIRDLVANADGTRLATAGGDRTVRVWDARTGTPLLSTSCPVAAANVVAFARDDKRLAAVCDDGTVEVWDAATGTRHAKLTGHTGPVRALAFLPDGSLLSGGDDSRIIRWALSEPEARARICAEVGRELTDAERRDHVAGAGPERRCS